MFFDVSVSSHRVIAVNLSHDDLRGQIRTDISGNVLFGIKQRSGIQFFFLYSKFCHIQDNYPLEMLWPVMQK